LTLSASTTISFFGFLSSISPRSFFLSTQRANLWVGFCLSFLFCLYRCFSSFLLPQIFPKLGSVPQRVVILELSIKYPPPLLGRDLFFPPLSIVGAIKETLLIDVVCHAFLPPLSSSPLPSPFSSPLSRPPFFFLPFPLFPPFFLLFILFLCCGRSLPR